MPAENASEVVVEYAPEFKRNLRELAKRYRHIRSDVEPIIEQLQMGQVPGDQVPGTPFTIFKVRIRNSDTRKGKSGGYRMIYYLRTGTQILLVTIYSKLEQGDISARQIRKIVLESEGA